jgi:thiol-disulfide isomerase/thioredoxin
MKNGCTVVLFFIIFNNSGCHSRDPKNDLQTKRDIIPGQQADIQVATIDETGLRNLVSQRNGKVLLLNVWATWCLPCVEEFPDLVKLANTFNSEYEIIGISVDDSEDIESKVVPFLKNNAVSFKVYLAKFDKQEDFINELNSSWNGAIPATFIYDSNGRQYRSLFGKQSYQQFKEAIEKTHVVDKSQTISMNVLSQ